MKLKITFSIFFLAIVAQAQITYFEQDFETSDPITNIRNTYGGPDFDETELRVGASICDFAGKGNATTHSSTNLTYNSGENATEFLAYNPESNCGGFSGALARTEPFDMSGEIGTVYLSLRYHVSTTIPYGSGNFIALVKTQTEDIIGWSSSETFTERDTWAFIEVALPATANVANVFMEFDIFGGNAVAIDDIKVSNQPTLSKIDITRPLAINIYPNPTSNGFINFSNSKEKSIQIFDVLGKLVASSPSVTKTLGVSQLKKGVYILKIQIEANHSTKKLIIQ